jgi:hypothetical protein
MMLYLYVQQNQWIIITLMDALALVLVFCLTYHAMWLPRGVEGKSETIKVRDIASFFTWLKSFVPWVIILLILTSIAFTIVRIALNACRPPNW